ncbi:MAG: hypothetical protein NDI94_02515 [Candidatus Woesearchaeota archaeon]|nr:hypothetical protein [Candidatus Woesearchaeota archaeon]
MIERIGHIGPPIEFLVIELIYVLLVVTMSLIIYFKTKELYDLSRHKGIFHFRNIFLFFSLSYIFRLVQLMFPLSKELFSFYFPFMLMPINLIFISYFSTMAILSLIMALIVKEMKGDGKRLDIVMHGVAIAASIVVFLTRSPLIMLSFQLAVFLISLVMMSLNFRKTKHEMLMTQNNMTYILLFIFWCINTVTMMRGLIARELHIPLNLLSTGVFFWVFSRVQKRLGNGKKKR